MITQVLVHCVSGGSRSGCMAMAYLIKSRRLCSEDAESEVRNRRKMVLLEVNSDHDKLEYAGSVEEILT